MTINWDTATSGEIVNAMKIAVEKLRSQTGHEATHCNTPLGCFLLRPVPRVIKVKKGPGKRRTVPVYFARVGK